MGPGVGVGVARPAATAETVATPVTSPTAAVTEEAKVLPASVPCTEVAKEAASLEEVLLRLTTTSKLTSHVYPNSVRRRPNLDPPRSRRPLPLLVTTKSFRADSATPSSVATVVFKISSSDSVATLEASKDRDTAAVTVSVVVGMVVGAGMGSLVGSRVGPGVGLRVGSGTGVLVDDGAQARVIPAGVTQPPSPVHTFHPVDPGHSKDPG